MTVKQELWREYRLTWDKFSKQLELLQSVAESGDRESARQALLEVEQARLQHNTARDRLAQHLSEGLPAGHPTSQPASQPAFDEHRIRGAARMIWEFSAKQQNTAEADWRQAEKLVRSVSA